MGVMVCDSVCVCVCVGGPLCECLGCDCVDHLDHKLPDSYVSIASCLKHFLSATTTTTTTDAASVFSAQLRLTN